MLYFSTMFLYCLHTTLSKKCFVLTSRFLSKKSQKSDWIFIFSKKVLSQKKIWQNAKCLKRCERTVMRRRLNKIWGEKCGKQVVRFLFSWSYYLARKVVWYFNGKKILSDASLMMTIIIINAIQEDRNGSIFRVWFFSFSLSLSLSMYVLYLLSLLLLLLLWLLLYNPVLSLLKRRRKKILQRTKIFFLSLSSYRD